jgi:hypothetical protein
MLNTQPGRRRPDQNSGRPYPAENLESDLHPITANSTKLPEETPLLSENYWLESCVIKTHIKEPSMNSWVISR